MTVEPRISCISQTTFCSKVFRVSLYERDGYSPQIRIETFVIDPGSAQLRLQHTLPLRVGPGIEVAHAILAAANAYHAAASADRATS